MTVGRAVGDALVGDGRSVGLAVLNSELSVTVSRAVRGVRVGDQRGLDLAALD